MVNIHPGINAVYFSVLSVFHYCFFFFSIELESKKKENLVLCQLGSVDRNLCKPVLFLKEKKIGLKITILTGNLAWNHLLA